MRHTVDSRWRGQDGLAAARDADPETRAKMEVRDWIEQCLDSLQTQKDSIEAELEVIRSKQKKTTKGQTDREIELDGYRERHNYHVQRLELMLRLLDNDNLSVDEINGVKDDVNYYIESNQDPDFQVSLAFSRSLSHSLALSLSLSFAAHIVLSASSSLSSVLCATLSCIPLVLALYFEPIYICIPPTTYLYLSPPPSPLHTHPNIYVSLSPLPHAHTLTHYGEVGGRHDL